MLPRRLSTDAWCLSLVFAGLIFVGLVLVGLVRRGATIIHDINFMQNLFSKQANLSPAPKLNRSIFVAQWPFLYESTIFTMAYDVDRKLGPAGGRRKRRQVPSSRFPSFRMSP
jgi:hypothetical protein